MSVTYKKVKFAKEWI